MTEKSDGEGIKKSQSTRENTHCNSHHKLQRRQQGEGERIKSIRDKDIEQS